MKSTRQEAIDAREMYYFTGVPCKRGHVVKRYTRNGSCFLCLHPQIEDPERTTRTRRRAALKRLITARFRLFDGSAEIFRRAVLASAWMREASLKPNDIESVRKPVRGEGLALVSFWFFSEDIEMLRDLEKQLDPRKPTVKPVSLTISEDVWPEGDPK